MPPRMDIGGSNASYLPGKKTIEIIDFESTLLILALTLALPFRSIKSVREIGS